MPERTPRRILILTTDLGARGGVQLASRMTVRALAPLAASGVRIDVWAVLDGIPAPPGIAIWAAHGRRAALGWRTLAHLRDVDAQTLILVLHTHVAPLAIPAALRGARVALCLMGVEVWRPLKRAERWVAQHAWQVMAISQYTARRFRARNPSVDRAVTICPLGVPDTSPGRPASAAPPRALIVSRLAAEDAYKGHDRLIEIWPRVRSRVPDARLTIVGDGDDRARLHAKVAAAGLADAIVFEGEVDDAQLAALYDDSACYVMPSPHEGFGLTFLEAMRARRPCIAAPGAAEEVVIDGATGIIVASDQSADLAEALVRLLQDPTIRTAMGDAGRARYESRFTERHFAERLRGALGL